MVHPRDKPLDDEQILGVADDPGRPPPQIRPPVRPPLPHGVVRPRFPARVDVIEADHARVVEHVEHDAVGRGEQTYEAQHHRLRPELNDRIFPEPRVIYDPFVKALNAGHIRRRDQRQAALIPVPTYKLRSDGDRRWLADHRTTVVAAGNTSRRQYRSHRHTSAGKRPRVSSVLESESDRVQR